MSCLQPGRALLFLSAGPRPPPFSVFDQSVLRVFDLANQHWGPTGDEPGPGWAHMGPARGDGLVSRQLTPGKDGAGTAQRTLTKEGSDPLFVGRVRACRPHLAPQDPFVRCDHTGSDFRLHPLGPLLPLPGSRGPGVGRPRLSLATWQLCLLSARCWRTQVPRKVLLAHQWGG